MNITMQNLSLTSRYKERPDAYFSRILSLSFVNDFLFLELPSTNKKVKAYVFLIRVFFALSPSLAPGAARKL